jgi:hypothetical protein
MVKTKHSVLLLFIVLGFVAYWYLRGRYRTPSGQAPLTSLTANNLNQFKEAFNDTADLTRLVLLVSRTSQTSEELAIAVAISRLRL